MSCREGNNQATMVGMVVVGISKREVTPRARTKDMKGRVLEKGGSEGMLFGLMIDR